MRKLISLLLAMLCLLTLFGCGAKEAAAPTGKLTAKDFGIALEGNVYYLREDSAPLIKALGDAYDFSESTSCVYDGKDKIYEYKGVRVHTVPVGGKDIIEMIVLTDASCATLRGAKTGFTRDKLIALYGEDYFDDGYLTYSLTNDPEDIQAERIQFEFLGDALNTIYIYSPSY